MSKSDHHLNGWETCKKSQKFEKYPVLKAAIEDIAKNGLSLIRWDALLSEINIVIEDLEGYTQ